MRKVGMITIGQSPRDDIVSVMRRYLPSDVEVLERGALDGLDAEAVTSMRPKKGEPTLVTTMRDGTEVTVTHAKVVPLMKRGVEELADKGAGVVVILCTGGFEELRSDGVTLVDAGSLLQGVIGSLAKGGRLGVVQPSADQVTEWGAGAKDRWGALDVVITSASPYAAPEVRVGEWERAAEELKESGVDMVFLNCMGMDESMKQVVRRVTQKPVVLASSVVARMVDELMGPEEYACTTC